MEHVIEEKPSAFAQIIDNLRKKSDEELKIIYTRLLSDELKTEWENITASADFSNCTEEDIIAGIQENRYKGKYE